MDRNKMKILFYECISKISQKKNSFQMSSEKYENLIKEVKKAKSSNKKINRQYWLLKHYDVLTMFETDQLIFPTGNDTILYYIPIEQVFDILYDTHESINHGGRDRMRKELQQQYKNITLQEIQTFLNLCQVCLQKKPRKKSFVIKPKVFSHLNNRCLVDLIDYQLQPDNEYKFVMIYQDCSTKFVILRPLKSAKAEEVACNLLDIFLLFGASTILQSESGREFCNDIIRELKIKWPELKIICGRLCHSESQGNVNQDIKNMLVQWMLDNDTKNWSKALGFVQFTKNRTSHAEIKKSPHEAMFGQIAKVGLASTNIPEKMMSLISTEEELELMININEMKAENDKLFITE